MSRYFNLEGDKMKLEKLVLDKKGVTRKVTIDSNGGDRLEINSTAMISETGLESYNSPKYITDKSEGIAPALARELFKVQGVEGNMFLSRYNGSCEKGKLFSFNEVAPLILEVFERLIKGEIKPLVKAQKTYMVAIDEQKDFINPEHVTFGDMPKLNKLLKYLNSTFAIAQEIPNGPAASHSVLNIVTDIEDLPGAVGTKKVAMGSPCPKNESGHEFVGVSCFSAVEACKHCDGELYPTPEKERRETMFDNLPKKKSSSSEEVDF